MEWYFLMNNINILLLIICCGSIIKASERNKRYIYFPYGGSYKLVMSVAVPVMLPQGQSLIWATNFQFQYPQITNLTQIASDLPPVLNRRKRFIQGKSEWAITYMAIEAVMDKYGINGKACLLRSICENAMYSLHHDVNGLYGQLLHILLTPNYGTENNNETDISNEYFDAKYAGDFGVDCLSLYPNCPIGHGILDFISTLEE